jgi:RNA polymerase sigma factor (sigma-70 family)
MKIEKKAQPEPTEEQLREAEEGLIRLLFAKGFTREWVERHVQEAMAQAQTELAARIAAGREDETVGLLVVIAYRRALKALSAERARPRSVPVEEVFDIADEYARTPEQIVMDGDRQARLLRAMHYLPDREKELLGLVYYGELDVKEAGRRLGWSSSSAERHHKEALAKLRVLVGERSLLGADVAAPALIASHYSLPMPGLHHWLEAAGDRVCHLAGWALQHSHSITEGGSAVGMSGPGRTSVGLCGLAVAACMVAVIFGAALRVSVFDHSGSARAQPQVAAHRTEAEIPAPAEQSEGAPASQAASSEPLRPRPNTIAASEPRQDPRRRQTSAKLRRGDAGAAMPAAGAHTTEGFGVEGGGVEFLSQPNEASSATPPALPLPSNLPPPSAAKGRGCVDDPGWNGLACFRREWKAPNANRALPGAG